MTIVVIISFQLPSCVVNTLTFIDRSTSHTANPPLCHSDNPRGYTLHPGAERVVTRPESLAPTTPTFQRGYHMG